MRLRALDGVRGVAILAVLANHTGSRVGRGGYLGVDVFFVLSGYLITAMLVSERERTHAISLGRFYVRRALRLYPALIVTCACALALSGPLGFADRAQALRGVGAAAGYLQDIAINAGWDTGTPLLYTWSLAIEEHFYLVWPPVLALLIARRSSAWVVAVIAAGLAWSGTVLWSAFSASSSPTSSVYYRPDARAGALLVGCLTALWLVRARPTVPQWLGWVCTAAVLGAMAAAPEANTQAVFVVWMPVTWLACAGLIADLVSRRESRLSRTWSVRPLAYIGLISYGLYLYHPLVFDLVSTQLSWPRRYGSPLAIVISIVLGSLSFRFLESPILQYKRRFETVGSPARP